MPTERLQKIMAKAGYGSRRSCEKIIADGKVSVNGKMATLGMKADPYKDKILVEGQEIKVEEALVYIALHKPRRVLSRMVRDEERSTLLDLVNVAERVYPVGRLDYNSEGLILLTNDGELTNRLTHPRYGHEKEYRVRVSRKPDEEQIATLKRGVVLADGHKTAPAQVRVGSTQPRGTWMQMIIKEGRKRQIREMGLAVGLSVNRLIRVRIGNLQLGKLRPGKWRLLTSGEINSLRRMAGLDTHASISKKNTRH